MIPIIIKNELPYIEHYCPAEKQMSEISGVEIMTSKNDRDQSKLLEYKQ